MNLNHDLAREIVRERSITKTASSRRTHPRAARALRRLAERMERDA